MVILDWTTVEKVTKVSKISVVCDYLPIAFWVLLRSCGPLKMAEHENMSPKFHQTGPNGLKTDFNGHNAGLK